MTEGTRQTGRIAMLGAAAAALVTAACAPPVPRAGADAGAPGGKADHGRRSAPDAGGGAHGPYPVVLAHGFFGFEEFAGVEFATYFYGVVDELAARGDDLVFTPAVDPFNDSTARGRQLLADVEDILAETGHAKVHLVGHSQGGLDVRMVAHTRPDLVASVTTIATPHGGTRLADVALGLARSDFTRTVIDDLVRLIGAPLYDDIGDETSVVDAIEQMTKAGTAAFAERYPDAPGVRYASIAGRTDDSAGAAICDVPDAPAWIARWSEVGDRVDPLLWTTELVVGALGDPGVNDGLVRVADARHGRFLGCIPADHLDQVGHLFENSPGESDGFDHLEFYADLVAWLRARTAAAAD